MLNLERQNELRELYRQANPVWRPATEVYAAFVRDNLFPETRVLDLGCGRGGLVEQLGHPLAQIVGVDPDWLSLTEHRLALPRVVGFSDDLPFAAESFDLIFCSWLLEHLQRPSRTFVSLSRILKSGGAFVFITPNGRHPLSCLNKNFGRLGRWQGKVVERVYGRAEEDSFSTCYRANAAADLRSLCDANGLQLLHLRAIPDPTYLAFTPALFRFMSWFETRLPASRWLHLTGICVKR